MFLILFWYLLYYAIFEFFVIWHYRTTSPYKYVYCAKNSTTLFKMIFQLFFKNFLYDNVYVLLFVFKLFLTYLIY